MLHGVLYADVETELVDATRKACNLSTPINSQIEHPTKKRLAIHPEEECLSFIK
jgi:hypothetical protein